MSKRRNGIRVSVVLAAVAVCTAAALAAPQAAPAPTLASEISHYVLTQDAFDRFVKAEKNLAALGESDTTLIATIAAHPSDEVRADWVRRIEARPPKAEAIRSAGISPHDYLLVAGALVQAYTVVNRKANGRELPKELDGTVPAQNLEFVKSHMTEFTAWHGASGSSGKPSLRANTMEDIYAPEAADKTAEGSAAAVPVAAGNTPPAVAPASAPDKSAKPEKPEKKDKK